MRSDDLEKLVRAERKKLVDAAIATRTVDKDAFDCVDRLSKLAAEAQPARRWLMLLIALILLTVFLGLLIKEQHETEIELDLAVTELHFGLPMKERLTEDQFLRSLNASALDGIELDGAYWPAPKGGTCSLWVDLVGPVQKEEAITLSSLAPPKNWGIGVSRTGLYTDFEFTAAPTPVEEAFLVQAALRGKAVLRTDCTTDGKYRSVDWAGPALLTMRIGTATTLHCQSDLPVIFARQIEFQNLRLYAIERVQIDAGPVDYYRSSLLSGTLYLDALSAKPVALRPFEDLTFGSSKGYIRALVVATDPKFAREELHLQAHAAVQKMKLGSGTNQRSQMPSWLEVITAQTGIALLWASVTYVLGIIYAALRWFKVIN